MATRLMIDATLVEEAVTLGGHRTKRDAVHAALEEYVTRRKQRGVLELFGKLDCDPSYDYKKDRQRR